MMQVLKLILLQTPQLLGGIDGLNTAASWPTANLVVTGIVGCAGLLPTLAAIKAGKDIALANKETLIAAGPVVLPELKKSGSRLLPADSEHSAIFQCLQGTPWPENARLSTGIPNPGLHRILLTASGGAARPALLQFISSLIDLEVCYFDMKDRTAIGVYKILNENSLISDSNYKKLKSFKPKFLPYKNRKQTKWAKALINANIKDSYSEM